MGIIRGFFLRFFIGVQRKELNSFLEKLKGMDGAELGMPLAVATHFRHALEAAGHMPMDMIPYIAINPAFAQQLSRQANAFQSAGNLMAAVGPMVWCHTARAAISQELRPLARAMWGELARGLPHIDAANVMFRQMSGSYLDIEGASDFPIGFTPEPL